MVHLVSKLLMRYGSTALLTLAPMFTLEYSLLDLVGLAETENKKAVEFLLRFGVSSSALGLAIAAEIVDFYLPSRNVRRFRRTYLDKLCSRWLEEAKFPSELKPEFRFCLLDLRHPWYLGFLPKFERAWRSEPVKRNDPDKRFWLLGWQGPPGAARKSHELHWKHWKAPFSSLDSKERRMAMAEYLMFGWQLRRMGNVRGILSVPVLQKVERSDEDRFRCVGVLNVEALTDRAVKFLEEHADRTESSTGGGEANEAQRWKQLGNDLAKQIGNVGDLRV